MTRHLGKCGVGLVWFFAITLASTGSLLAADDFVVTGGNTRGVITANGTSLGSFTANETTLSFGNATWVGNYNPSMTLPNLLVNPRWGPTNVALTYTNTAGFARPPADFGVWVVSQAAPGAPDTNPPVPFRTSAISFKSTNTPSPGGGSTRFTLSGSLLSGGTLSINTTVSGLISEATGNATTDSMSDTYAWRNGDPSSPFYNYAVTGRSTAPASGDAGNCTVYLNEGSSLIVNPVNNDPFVLGPRADVHGIIQLGMGGAAGTLEAGSLDGGPGGGGVVFAHNEEPVTFSLPLTGNVTVEQRGPGTTLLTGNNTHSGGTLVTGGTLSITAASALGSGTVTITGGTFAPGGNLTLGDVSLFGGTLTVNATDTLSIASLTWKPGGTLRLPVGPTSQPLTISGPLARTVPGKFPISLDDQESVIGQPYVLVTASGGITGFVPGDFTVTGQPGILNVTANQIAFTPTALPRPGVTLAAKLTEPHLASIQIANTGNVPTTFRLRAKISIRSLRPSTLPPRPAPRRLFNRFFFEDQDVTSRIRHGTFRVTLQPGASARLDLTSTVRAPGLRFGCTVRVAMTAYALRTPSVSANDSLFFSFPPTR